MLPLFEQAAQEVRALVLDGDRDKARTYERWVEQQRNKFKPHSFNGTVHCEASLMAALLDPTTGAGKCIPQSFKVSAIFVYR